MNLSNSKVSQEIREIKNKRKTLIRDSWKAKVYMNQLDKMVQENEEWIHSDHRGLGKYGSDNEFRSGRDIERIYQKMDDEKATMKMNMAYDTLVKDLRNAMKKLEEARSTISWHGIPKDKY